MDRDPVPFKNACELTLARAVLELAYRGSGI